MACVGTIAASMPKDATQTEPPGSTEVRIDIACPGCEYNLRGLPGPIVDCPECGLCSNVAELATRQWDKPWYKAPGFNTLCWPGIWAFICLFFVQPGLDMNGFMGPLGLAVAWLLSLIGWVTLMYRAYRALGGLLGVWLALLMHILVVGFIVGAFGLFIMIVVSVVALYERDLGPISATFGFLSVAVIVLILWGCRRVERAIAGACIRHHLRRKPTD